MARRRRDDDLSFSYFHLFTFGSDDELAAAFGSLAAASAEWDRVRDRFLERWKLWGMPQAWWRFEPDIPDHLRSGPPMILTEADADQWRTLEQARRRYLLSIGIDPAPDHTNRGFRTGG